MPIRWSGSATFMAALMPRRPSPESDEHDDGPGPPAGHQRHAQVDAGRDHQCDPITDTDTVADEAGCGRRDERLVLVGVDRASVTGHLGDGEPRCRRGRDVHEGGRGGVRRGRPGGRRVERGDPDECGVEAVRVLRDEVAGRRIPVDVGVGEAGFEVVQVQVGEHTVGGTPQEERRDVPQVGQVVRDPVERRGAGVLRFERDVRDELADRGAATGGAIRRQEPGPDIGGRALVGDLEGAANEGGRGRGDRGGAWAGTARVGSRSARAIRAAGAPPCSSGSPRGDGCDVAVPIRGRSARPSRGRP